MEKTEQEKQQEFLKEYEELCKKHGMALVSIPSFVPSGHGTFEIWLKVGVKKLESK